MLFFSPAKGSLSFFFYTVGMAGVKAGAMPIRVVTVEVHATVCVQEYIIITVFLPDQNG